MENREHYYNKTYMRKERFFSYIDQMSVIQKYSSDSDELLEVGIGNGYLTNVLKNYFNYKVKTLDIMPDLHPDICADIAKKDFDLDQQFDITVCFEVFEHIKWELLPLVVENLLKHTKKYLIISVPNINHYMQFKLNIFRYVFYAKNYVLSFPRIGSNKSPLGKSHCWEIGVYRDKSKITPTLIIKELFNNRTVVESFRGREFPVHHFFVVQGQANIG